MARRIGSHSTDGGEGLHVVETDENLHVVASFKRASDPTDFERRELNAFLEFVRAVQDVLARSRSAKEYCPDACPQEQAACSLAIELRHGRKTIRIEQPLCACVHVGAVDTLPPTLDALL